MSIQEILPGPSAIYKQSSAGTVVSDINSSLFTGVVWGTSGYIEIDPTNKTYQYDFIYSNTEGSLFYIGFEKYDENKTSTSNNSCVYFLANTNGATDKRIKGTINLATDSNGATTKYIKLRVLNHWNSSSSGLTDPMAEIKACSLREISGTNTADFQKNGNVEANIRQYPFTTLSLQKDSTIDCYDIIEY